MWISQRVGRNTAITSPLWVLVVGALFLVGVVVQVWPLLVAAGVVFAGYLMVRGHDGRVRQSSALSESQLDPRVLAKEYRRLAARERLEQGRGRPRGAMNGPVDLEHMARLQLKYYGRP